MEAGQPGVKKSPALSKVMPPFNKLEAIERERFKQEETVWNIDLELKNLLGLCQELHNMGYRCDQPTRNFILRTKIN
jgi:hypothetical protein